MEDGEARYRNRGWNFARNDPSDWRDAELGDQSVKPAKRIFDRSDFVPAGTIVKDYVRDKNQEMFEATGSPITNKGHRAQEYS